MRGLSLISAAVSFAIVIAAVTIVLNVGMPLLDRMKDSAAIDHNLNVLREVDETIRSVASGSRGSSRSITISLQRGGYVFDNGTDTIYYRIETGSDIVPAGTTQRRGSILLSAGKASDGQKTVKAILNYSRIDLTGGAWSFQQGTYEIDITHAGIEDGKTAVNVTLD